MSPLTAVVLILLVLFGYWIYNLFRHPISKLKNSLDVLLAHETNGAWIQFHHHPSATKLTFVKEIVGGVPSIIYVNRNALDGERLEQLKAIVQNYSSARLITNFQRKKTGGKGTFWQRRRCRIRFCKRSCEQNSLAGTMVAILV